MAKIVFDYLKKHIEISKENLQKLLFPTEFLQKVIR